MQANQQNTGYIKTNFGICGAQETHLMARIKVYVILIFSL